MAKRAEPHAPSQIVAAVADRPALFAPGAQWAYSNTGYVLLGMMIEARAGQPYAEYMKARLFDRAGLTRTVVGDAGARRRLHGGRVDQQRRDRGAEGRRAT